MEPRIIIDGHEYPMPKMSEVTMGQARILKRYTNASLEKLGTNLDATDPDLIAAFCHLALMPERPGKTFSEIEAEVDDIRFAELKFEGEPDEGEPDEGEGEGEGGDASPPDDGPSVTESEPDGFGGDSDTPMGATPATSLPRIGAVG